MLVETLARAPRLRPSSALVFSLRAPLQMCCRRAASRTFSSSIAARAATSAWKTTPHGSILAHLRPHSALLRATRLGPSLIPDAFSAVRLASTKAKAKAKSPNPTPKPASEPPPPPPETGKLPALASPAVGKWLLVSSLLVFAVIVVGGVTRLTESGLSITEWRLITGTIPPLSEADWQVEFNKYQETPEFKLLNHSITVEEFKKIFYMEWAHRLLGRVIGLGFVLPLTYFALSRQISARLGARLFGMALLLGGQGALGWYMVQSGLEDELLDTPGAVPRVSHYRLAAHLGAAFVLYASMFYTGLSVLKDYRFANGGEWHKGAQWINTLRKRPVRSFLRRARLLTGLVFVTALSGALVAGLDAGLLYNEFPLMGGQLVPPTDELFSPAFSKVTTTLSEVWHDLLEHPATAQIDFIWRNLLENPITVQFNHRVLAVTTYFATGALFATTLTRAAQLALPRATITMMRSAFIMANVQVALGISTLLLLVPVPLAALHQAGSVALLTTMVHVLLTLRRPGQVALVWRRVLSPPKVKAGKR